MSIPLLLFFFIPLLLVILTPIVEFYVIDNHSLIVVMYNPVQSIIIGGIFLYFMGCDFAIKGSF